MQAAIVTTPIATDNMLWKLPQAERARISELLGIFKEIEGSNKITVACKEISFRYRNYDRGFSWQSLTRLYKDYKASGGDWTVLIREYKGPDAGLPQEFQDWARGFILKGCRDDVASAAIMRLKRMWLDNHNIPGYGRLTEWWAIYRKNRPLPRGVFLTDLNDFPHGWSDRNLLRLLPKSKSIRKLAKRGIKAAHDNLMKLGRDRSNLRALQLVTFDDVRLDIQVAAELNGKLQTTYVNAVFAMDVASGMIISHYTKPRWKREDDTHMSVTRDETKKLLLGILEGYGVPQGYKMNLLMENASATLSADDKRFLSVIMDGHIEIENTGLIRRAILDGGFREQGGTPWEKGWIESYFRRLHTAMNYLPGVTGNKYDNDPGDLQSKLSYTKQILKAAQKNNIPLNDLWLPILTEEQLAKVLQEIVNELNWRTKHSLQGFEDIHEFYDPANNMWRPFEEMNLLPPDVRLTVKMRSRVESPAERFYKLQSREQFLVPSPAALYPLFLDKRNVTVRNRQIELSDKSFSNDKLVYRVDGAEALSDDNEGRSYKACLSHDRNFIHLWTNDDKLIWMGSIARIGFTDIADRDAIKIASGEVHRSREREIAEAARLRMDDAIAYTEGRKHNELVLGRTAEGAAMIETERKKPKEKFIRHEELQAKRIASEAAIATKLDEEDAF